jgi:hypothetical protein
MQMQINVNAITNNGSTLNCGKYPNGNVEVQHGFNSPFVKTLYRETRTFHIEDSGDLRADVIAVKG